MKIMESAENYLETILILTKRTGSVRSVDIANELNFSKPSVSVAMKNLREKNLIRVGDDGLIELLPEGLAIAEMIYERHLLLTKWLEHLGVNPDTAVADACRVEHVISQESFEAIKNHILGHIENVTF
ncbi:MAG: metal-dependent transcriptional regulator [Tissierellia bacterium]|nr:metal-dependent transcriptional regulator [Tissierellia bacterium]